MLKKVFVNLVCRLLVKRGLFGKMLMNDEMEGRENCQILYGGCLEDIFQGLSQIILDKTDNQPENMHRKLQHIRAAKIYL